MKKHQTSKHKRQQKKELTNRKAKQEQSGKQKELLDRMAEQPLVTEIQLPPHTIVPDTPSLSPARRAFQDV